MTIRADIQQLAPGGRVVLYELDCSGIGGDVSRYHPHQQSASIWFQGKEYTPWAIDATGFERTSDAQQPSPKLTVGNVGGAISALCVALEDLVGAKLIRHQTLVQYLDAVNFPDGNPTADPDEEMPQEVWYIEQRSAENNVQVEFTLSSPLDFGGQQLPGRQIANLCQFQYRDAYCGYTGTNYFTIKDVATDNPALDQCSKRISGCECRFGVNEPLSYGGFLSDTLS